MSPTLLPVMRSEWIKLRSLRSVWFTAMLAVGSMVFFGALGAMEFANRWDDVGAVERATMDPTAALMSGWFMAQVIVGVLGVLAVTAEYASGSMLGTLSAVPRRVPVLVAKLLVPALATIALLVPVTLATFWGAGVLLPDGTAPSLADEGVLRGVLGVPLCLGAICAIGGAMGFVLRSSAGALAMVVTVLLVLPGLLAGFSKAVYTYLPGGAIDAIVTVDRTHADLPLLAAGAATLVFAAYVVASVIAARESLLRRDA